MSGNWPSRVCRPLAAGFRGYPARMSPLGLLVLLASLAVAPAMAAAQEPGLGLPDGVPTDPARREALERAFADGGFVVDFERREIRFPVRVNLLWDPLEYLLVVQPQGRDHESLFAVDEDEIDVRMLNAAMLLFGVEPGTPGTTEAVQPRPTPEEVRRGADTVVTHPARGDGFYLTAYWTETMDDGRVEEFCYRVEDLVLNARESRTYQRGHWVYLGSRFVKPHEDAGEYWSAEREGNLISLVAFGTGHELLTGADPDSGYQDVWFPNVFLLPEVGHQVELVFSLDPPPCPPGGTRPAASAAGAHDGEDG